ncbi:MAG TPA: PilZ domain-containing protein [Thermoanaerobaculia bacterium]|jgi:hypothetical protein
MLNSRRSERFTLPTPVDATAGLLPVTLIDVSRSGFKVHHQEPLPKGTVFTLRFRWGTSFARVQCTAMWTTVHRLARSTAERPTLSSGLRIESLDPAAERIVSSILGSIPGAIPGAITGAADEVKELAVEPYLFCELVAGSWKQHRTTRRDQPGEGFTVSANEEPAQVERLCSAYASGDSETRKLIRTLAALSIKKQGDDAARTMNA